MVLSSTFSPLAFMSSTAFTDVDTFGHGLSWTSVEFLVQKHLDLSFLRGLLHSHGSFEELQQVFHTCDHSLTNVSVRTR